MIGVDTDKGIAAQGIVVTNVNAYNEGEEPVYRFAIGRGVLVSYLDKPDENGDYYIESGTSINCVLDTLTEVNVNTLLYVSAKDEPVQSAKAGGMFG